MYLTVLLCGLGLVTGGRFVTSEALSVAREALPRGGGCAPLTLDKSHHRTWCLSGDFILSSG